MRLINFIFLITILCISCKNNSIPDVSAIKIDLTVERFEKSFFDSSKENLFTYLQQINNNPTFAKIFLEDILNIDPQWPADSSARYVNDFIIAYRPVYDSAEKIFTDFSFWEKEIKKGLQFVKYYFPNYKAPSKIITYIGPLDGYGDILTDDAFVIGLQHHLGQNFSLYKSDITRLIYPEYISRRFEPAYIAINCMRNVVLDMFPEKMEDKSLLYQMVEKGKRLYILQKILPNTDEHMLIGYTQDQMKGCYENEQKIWDLFVQNNFLQTIDINIIKNYIGESPKTQEFGDASPGNIGSFTGWQIVKKFVSKNPGITPDELMKMDAEMIFEKAKYKP